jgi:hypothetical protein
MNSKINSICETNNLRCKKINSIWKMDKDYGSKARNFKEIYEMEVAHIPKHIHYFENYFVILLADKYDRVLQF